MSRTMSPGKEIAFIGCSRLKLRQRLSLGLRLRLRLFARAYQMRAELRRQPVQSRLQSVGVVDVKGD